MTFFPDSPVMALKDLHLEGNIIPMEWFGHLKFGSGKPDMNAILILSDIVYWYRPVVVRDEQTGMIRGYRKKFKSDLLQKSYQQYADLFGLSKRQVCDAIIRLEEKGLIKRVFRNVETASMTLQNILFIALDVQKLAEINTIVGGVTFYRDTPHDRKGEVPRSSVTPPPIERETYTEITTEITTAHTNARAETVPRMLEIWNQRLRPAVPVQETPFRVAKLSAVLQEHFRNSLEEWQAFCRDLSQSSFLMGKGQRGWRVTLDWILEPPNLRKALEGNYRDTDPQAGERRAPEESEREAAHHVQGLCDPLLQKLAQGVIRTLGAPTYLSWFKDLRIADRSVNDLVLSCPTRFMRDWTETHFGASVLSVAQRLFPAIERVTWVVASLPEPSSAACSVSAPARKPGESTAFPPKAPPEGRPSSLKMPESSLPKSSGLFYAEGGGMSSPPSDFPLSTERNFSHDTP